MELTQLKLKEILKYDETTGIFTWNANRGRLAKKGNIAGTKNDKGYIVIKINRKIYRSHRLVYMYIYGVVPKDEIDHINHIRDDNRLVNLRIVNRYGNNRNRRLNKNNKSGTSGVYRNKNKVWYASIRDNDKLIHLGSFLNKSDAIKVRKEAEIKYGYHENHGNQI